MSTAYNGIIEGGKVGYIFPFLSSFLTYNRMDFEPDFVTIKTINSVALEGLWDIICEMRSESEFILHKICTLYLQTQQEQ